MDDESGIDWQEARLLVDCLKVAVDVLGGESCLARDEDGDPELTWKAKHLALAIFDFVTA